MKAVEKHSIWLRWVHWLNVPFLTLMIWSGILIYWANDIYPGFFPNWFYQTFHIDHRLAEGMAIHFTIAWLFVINGAIYLCHIFLSKHYKELFPDSKTFRNILPTILHDLHLRAQAPPQGKFNAVQRISYTGVILLAIVEVLSGFAIYKPVQLGWLTSLLGGYEMARTIHFIAMVSFVLFVFIHVIQVIRSGWNNFRAMVAGFEVEKNESQE
jgi:thiosulfate reductase cytochrome b subunit